MTTLGTIINRMHSGIDFYSLAENEEEQKELFDFLTRYRDDKAGVFGHDEDIDSYLKTFNQYKDYFDFLTSYSILHSINELVKERNNYDN